MLQGLHVFERRALFNTRIYSTELWVVLLAEQSRFRKTTARGTRTSPVTNARAGLTRLAKHVQGRLEVSTKRKSTEDIDEQLYPVHT